VRMAETPCAQLWSGNLLRLGNCLRLRMAASGAKKEYDEFLVGEGYGGGQVYCLHASGGREVGLLADAVVAVRRANGMATYEISLPFATLPVASPKTGGALTFTLGAIHEGNEKWVSEPVRLAFRGE
jgi:hypothetical protein